MYGFTNPLFVSLAFYSTRVVRLRARVIICRDIIGNAFMPYGGNFSAVGDFSFFGGNDFDGGSKTKTWR